MRAALSSTGFAVLLGPRDVDLLILLALGQRGYDTALAEHVAQLFHGALDHHGLGPDDAALAIGAPADTWVAAGQGLRRVRRSRGRSDRAAGARWHDARRPGLADLLHDLRDTPELDAFVKEQLGPLLDDATPRARALLETLEAYLAAGGRKAEAARALHLERQSLYLRLRRIEEALGVSLDDEDVVLGLHLAVRAMRFRRGAGVTVRRPAAAERDVPPIAGARGRGEHGRMTVADTVGTESLQEQAHRHLLMHFTRNGAFGPDGKPLLVLERGEGAYVFDTDGKRYFDGLSSLFCCQIGYSFGEEMAAVASGAAVDARVQHELGDRAPAGDQARRRARRARARRPQPRVLHQRRLGVGRGGLEDRPPALPGQGRAAAHEGDRARDRLPRRDAGRAVVHRRAADEGAVRRRADPGRADLQHQPLPRPGRRGRGRAAARGCWTRSSARSSRPGRRRWRC